VSSVNVGTGAVVVFRNSQAIPSGTPITLSGTINTDTSNVVGGGFITVLGALTFDGGTLTTAAGANSSDFQSYAFNNTVTVTGSTASSITSTSTSSAGNGIHLAHNTSGVSRTFNVADVTGDANADLTISARLVDSSNSQGATGMTKTGAGTLTLSGVNAYTGLTTVSAGTLSYGVADALSSGAVTVNGGILAVGNFSDTVGAVTLTSGSITGDTGVLTGTSYALDGAENTSVSAILGGTGALTKTGAGTATLSGSNTYTGDTTVSGGVLSLSGGAAIADTNTLLIIDNGKVDLASNETVDKLFIGGVQQAPGAYTSAHASNAFTGSGTLQVTSGPAGFSSWITGTFANGTVPEGQQGAGDDPDNDGISNLVEYAIAGLDPTVGNGALDTFTGLTLSFTKRQPLATDITYVIETSPDLQSPWTPQVTHTAPVNTDAIISHTLSDGPVKNFARLKVSQ
jgi:autotransporter-associated beta strand protein